MEHLMFNKRPIDKLVLRMPEGMRKQLLNITAETHRSLNSEIVYRLERSIDCEDELEQQKQLVQLLTKRVATLEKSL